MRPPEGGDVTAFHDLGEYMALPRTLALRLSPDGERLIAVVHTLAPDRTSHQTSLHQVEHGTLRRLTYSTPGAANPAFLPDGSVLFTPDGHGPAGGEGTALWLLPAGHGEARKILQRPGGIDGVATASAGGAIVLAADTLPGTAEADKDRRDRRAKADVTAVLHEDHPIRAWDHQLGPGERRLFLIDPPGPDEPAGPARDLTPDPGHALLDQDFAITPDATTVITGWWVADGRGERHSELIAIDTATGRRSRLAAADGADFHAPVIAPDGRSVVCIRETHVTYDEPADVTLWHITLPDGAGQDLTPDLDLWPTGPAWSPDSQTVYFHADERGRHPVFSIDVTSGHTTRLTSDDAAYTDLLPTPDGHHLYALRATIATPPAPVRLDIAGTAGKHLALTDDAPAVPGTVAEIATTVDGSPIRAWLVLPDRDTPAPLLLWPHGGPNSSWNTWSWRWNPWIMAAHGYAVLLPDPALSTGYGQDYIRRAHGAWGGVTYDDLMAITDTALARADIDATRTAVMGGSFGGYMANWIAGQTDRFDAIVTHASLWPFDTMVTSDEGHLLAREFGEAAARWAAGDPSRHAGKISTPMLIIHGDRDYRVPIHHGLQLWWDLLRNDVQAKFLYYPDENHWIQRPGNATVWYETVLAFLAQHVLGAPWKRPDLL
jgi:dipeptidyl aminopeptidase/acylaminoacyl peptidase